jgi:hypothetical protein
LAVRSLALLAPRSRRLAWVAVVLMVIRLVGAALGTDLANCSDCAVREMKMNGMTMKT